ncbi:MAG TPA: DJ-1/PfpI family protein [Acidimicrobiales bacterium]|jgi:transcriptional regulator GlxA family with amidase domain|nr:DJ-1/PfpI family protein [Acidimicrobiales bacterium]
MSTIRVAVVAYEGFNELDVFANLHILNRVTRVRPEVALRAELVGPAEVVRSMYGVPVTTARPLAAALADGAADAVVVGSGGTLDAIADEAFMAELAHLDPGRRLIGSQCSGALVLQRLGLLGDRPACTDDTFRPHLEAAGVTVLDQPFVAHGNVGTAGGCLSAAHLSAWVLSRLVDAEAAAATLATVAPVGEREAFVARVMDQIGAADHAPVGPVGPVG